MNTAVTDRSVLMVTVHAPDPLHAPLQWSNFDPASAAAVSVTTVPESYDAEQFDPHSMPAPLTLPEPSPELATSRVKRIFAKTAVTASSASIVSMQGPVPVHAPLQWSNFDPAAGVAVNVTL